MFNVKSTTFSVHCQSASGSPVSMHFATDSVDSVTQWCIAFTEHTAMLQLLDNGVYCVCIVCVDSVTQWCIAFTEHTAMLQLLDNGQGCVCCVCVLYVWTG